MLDILYWICCLNSVPRRPCTDVPLPCWPHLLLSSTVVLALQKSRHFTMLGKHCMCEQRRGSYGTALVIGCCGCLSPRLWTLRQRHTLRICLKMGQGVWHRSGTKYIFFRSKKTSSFRAHLLLLYKNSLINVMVWLLISYYNWRIISRER